MTNEEAETVQKVVKKYLDYVAEQKYTRATRLVEEKVLFGEFDQVYQPQSTFSSQANALCFSF